MISNSYGNTGFIHLHQCQRTEMPLKRKSVIMKCPVEACRREKVKTWLCFRCASDIQFGLEDGLFYCKCASDVPSDAIFICPHHTPAKGSIELLDVSILFISILYQLKVSFIHLFISLTGKPGKSKENI